MNTIQTTNLIAIIHLCFVFCWTGFYQVNQATGEVFTLPVPDYIDAMAPDFLRARFTPDGN
ncbi:hypothetical protein QUF76_11490 [Desulfobacterales bacterium HSG16]|nr:hypothetical protein [Desulfobacterales bacterium HSG16]